MQDQLGSTQIRLNVYSVCNRPEHVHPSSIELIYVLEGSLWLVEGQQKTEMQAADIRIINAGHAHAITHIKNALACVVSINSSLFLDYSDAPLFWCDSTKDNDDSYARLRNLLQQILLEHISHRPDQDLQRLGLMYSLLYFLVTHYLIHSSPPSTRNRSDRGADRIAKISNYLEQHYAEPLSLQDVADHFFLSKAYLSKFFKKQFQINYIDYLNGLRLRHAVEELLYSDKPITRIALDSGFSSVAALNKQVQMTYHMTPSAYRAHHKKGEEAKAAQADLDAEVRQRVLEHLQVESRTDVSIATNVVRVSANVESACAYTPIWNQMMNLGAAKLLLQSDTRELLAMAQKDLGFRYVRIWSLFSAEMRMVQHDHMKQYNFSTLDSVLGALLDLGLCPFIELGELPDRILKDTDTAILPAKNETEFNNYAEFLSLLEGMMSHIVSHYGVGEVERWIFELWDDHRVEVYPDKQPYRTLFKDVEAIIHLYAPNAMLGGAGNRMGWHQQNTDISVRRWIDRGLYPAFISYNYYPYTTVNISSEKYTIKKTDEDDFLHTLSDLHRRMEELGFPPRKLFVTDWNSTVSQRNYINDSCWKACYILKNCLAVIDQLDLLAYSQLLDAPADFNDVTGILGGMAGLISRDGIRKPAYYAFAFLNKLQPLMLARNENSCITWDGNTRYSVILHNFKARNYLYYHNREETLPLDELYQCFENMDNLHIDVQVHGIRNGTYVLRKSKLSRKQGSVLDAWLQMDCFSPLRREDIQYLRDTCSPHVTISTFEVKDGTLTLPNDLQPLEIDLLELTRMAR